MMHAFLGPLLHKIHVAGRKYNIAFKCSNL